VSFAQKTKLSPISVESVKKESVREEPSNISTSKPDKFHLKNMFKNKRNFEKFIVESLSVIDIESKSQVKTYIDTSTKGLFFHNFSIKTPLISEFIYQLLKAPKAISKFLSIALMRNELLIFTFGMIFSFVCAHFLGEFKFNFKPLSPLRILYSTARFTSINAFRVWLFSLLFGNNFIPLGKIYMSSLTAVGSEHPILFKSSVYIQSLF
jgi:hypothetical protein